MGASCAFRTQTVSYDEIKESRVKEIRGTHLQDFVYIEVGNLSPLGGSWVLLYSNFIPCPCLWDLNFQWEVFPNLHQRYHCFWVWENVTLWMFFFFFASIVLLEGDVWTCYALSHKCLQASGVLVKKYWVCPTCSCIVLAELDCNLRCGQELWALLYWKFSQTLTRKCEPQQQASILY